VKEKFFSRRTALKVIWAFIRYEICLHRREIIIFAQFALIENFFTISQINTTKIPHFQSDIVHQSVYELVHSEDREELQRQLLWNSFLPPDLNGMPLSECFVTDKLNYLERSFTVRFRCLLDNTSGFLVTL
jgi:hypothetical protein